MTIARESATLRFSHLAYPLTSLGPGRRIGLWVAGCPLACPGCMTPELQAPDSGRQLPVDLLARRLLELPAYFDGLSLSGGEPFAQAEPLAILLEHVLSRRPQWSVIIFSGYPLDYLRRRTNHHRLLAQADILVAGPYQPHRAASKQPLLASSNQQLHTLSVRGRELFESSAQSTMPSVNLGLSRSSADWLIGLPSAAQRQALRQKLS